MDLISVIIPVFNKEQYLSRCLDSVISQTYTNLEIIIVDDGSTDKSSLILDEYKSKDKRIKIIHQKNGGLSNARNTGIDNSKGKYICFLDSDDYVDKNIYETLYKLITSNNADIACIGVDIFDDKGHRKYFNENLNEELICDKKAALHYHAVSENKYISTSSCDKIYKREIVLSKLFPENKFHEDLRVMSYWLSKANKVVYKNIPLYHYYYSSVSMTHGKFNPKWLTWIEANEERLEIYRKEDKEDIKYLNNTYVDNVLSLLYKGRKDKENKVEIKKMEQNFKIFLANKPEIAFSKKAKYKLRLYKISKHLYFFAMNIYELIRKVIRK